MITPSECRLRRHFERFLDGKWCKADEKIRVHGVPLSRLRVCVGVSGVVVRVKGWRFGVHRSAVDVMRGKPASDKSLGKEL